MNVFEKVVSSIGTLAGIAAWFLPDVSLEYKLIICLFIALASFICFYFSQLYSHKKTREKLDEIEKKHTALSQRFEVKLITIEEYKESMCCLYKLATEVITSNQRDRFRLFWEEFTLTNQNLAKRNIENE